MMPLPSFFLPYQKSQPVCGFVKTGKYFAGAAGKK
jgi:hypothetical protein